MESFRKVVIDSRWSYSLRWASSTRSSLAIARRTPSEGNRRPNSMSERKGADFANSACQLAERQISVEP